MILILSLVYFIHSILSLNCPSSDGIDCGVRGTQEEECKNKGCCWDSSFNPFCSCPSDSYTKYDEKNQKNKLCYSITPEGYYLDSDTYKKCYERCKSCKISGDESDNNCIECISGYKFYSEYKNEINCYPICLNYYYFDSSNNYYCVETCPQSYNKIVSDKKKCIDDCKNDDTYKFEYNNKCYNNCPEGTYELEDKTDKICYSETPEGYYLDINNKIYKKCFKNCKTCDQAGNETNHNCEECKNEYIYKYLIIVKINVHQI